DGTTSIALEQQQNRNFEGYLRGPLLEPVELKFTVPTTMIGVRLRPGVVFNLTGVAANSMVNRRASLSDFRALSELASLDSASRTHAEWIATLQDFLIRRLEGTSVHPLVAQVLAEIQAERGCVSIAEIAARCGASDRHLNRLMRDWIGYGPKR